MTWLMAPAPAGRLPAVRTLVVLYGVVWIAIRSWHWRDLSRLPASRWKPVGIAAWLDGPPSTVTVSAITVVTLAAGAAALAGVRWAVTGPLLAVGFLWLTTFGASWGQILHTEQLPALHLLVLAAAPAATSSGWPLKVLSAVTVATYFVAGVAKLRFGGGLDWLDGDGLMRLVAHDNVRKQLLGDPSSPVAPYMVGHPSLFRIFAVVTLIVELGAPLALLGRRLALVWIALAWFFHLGVLGVMAVLFPYPLVGIAFASMLPAERLSGSVRRASRFLPRQLTDPRRAARSLPPPG